MGQLHSLTRKQLKMYEIVYKPPD